MIKKRWWRHQRFFVFGEPCAGRLEISTGDQYFSGRSTLTSLKYIDTP